MTRHPDDRTPEEPTGASEGAEPGRRLDEDAAWAEIVAHYGERPEMGNTAVEPVETPEPGPAPSEPVESLFDRTYLDAQLERAARETPEPDTGLNSEASWDDEGHFVPPTPPPLPALDPRRKAAWIGLFGSPALMLLGIVLGWSYPSWISFLLVSGFVGGFGYLVATMPRTRGDDWSGDDGAVV